MTREDGLYDEMRYLRPQTDRFRSDPLALDEGTAERLLAGGLDPADAPPAYMRAAAVLAAASAPPSRNELAGEAQAVAALAAVACSTPHRAVPRRPAVLTRILSVKAAAATAVALLSLAGVAGAATTGNLPGPAQRAAHRMLGAAGVPAAHDKASATTDHSPTGPDASGAARAGLCRAWQAGQGGEQGKKNDSTAFKALATAAGGADKVAAYCADTDPASQGKGHDAAGKGSPASTVPAQAEDHGQGQGQGQPADPGAGHGQGSGQGQGTTPPSTVPDPHD